MLYFAAITCRARRNWLDWRASPLLAKSLARLPPAYVLTAGFDPLLDEGREYAERLQAEGVPYRVPQLSGHGAPASSPWAAAIATPRTRVPAGRLRRGRSRAAWAREIRAENPPWRTDSCGRARPRRACAPRSVCPARVSLPVLDGLHDVKRPAGNS